MNLWKEWVRSQRGLMPEPDIIGTMVDAGFTREEASGYVFMWARDPEVLHEGLRVTLHKGFMLDKECDIVIELFDRARMVPGKSYTESEDVEDSRHHTLCNFIDFQTDSHRVFQVLEDRISRLLDVPACRFQSFTGIHYEEGGGFTQHVDYFVKDDPKQQVFIEDQGNRVATVILYLNTVEEGGETYFDHLGFGVSPVKGSCLVFHYPECELESVHTARPVIKGEKYIMTKWVREHASKNAVGERVA